MDKRLERLARVHIRALVISEGDPAVQFDYLQQEVAVGNISPEDLAIEPQIIMADPDAQKMIVNAFKKIHPDHFKFRAKKGKVLEVLCRQIDFGRDPYSKM